MTKCDYALELLKQGFKVFPLEPNGKKPLIKDWQEFAQKEEELDVKAAWVACPEANIGISCGPSDLIVLDVDNKPDADGWASLEELLLFNKEVPTMRVDTPSGGAHYYYRRNGRTARNTVGKLGKGLDTRAIGGYVVGWGSTIDGKHYVINVDHELADAPDWVFPEVADVIQKEAVQASELDYKRALKWVLEEAPDSVQGQGGDATLYQVICEVKDMGLNARQTKEIIEQYNAFNCDPMWSAAEIQTKIENAYKYSQNSQGAKALPEFEDISTISPEPEEVPSIKTFSGADLNLLDIPPRDWIVYRRLICGFVTSTIAPGGTGKSMHSMVEAVAVATGRALLGETPKKTGPVIIYNIEDPLDEIQRRLCAIAIHYDIPFEDLKDVHLVSGLDNPLSIASTKDGVTGATKDYTKLVGLVKETKALQLILDPFVQVHSVDENSNNAVAVIGRLFSQLATNMQCAVNLVHHTRKLPSGTGAGDMDNARGASALVSAARIATTLTTMSESDAEHLQVPKDERHWYVRVDNAKGNMQPPAVHAEWFQKVSLTLPNGDDVGLLEPKQFKIADLRDQLHRKAQLLAHELAEKFKEGEVAFADAVKFCKECFDFEGMSTAKIRRNLLELFKEPVEYEGIKVTHLQPMAEGAQRARHILFIESLRNSREPVAEQGTTQEEA